MSGLTTCEKVKIAIYASLVVIFNSAQMIVIPLSSERYQSLYFTILLVCFQFAVLAFVAMCIFARNRSKIPTEKTSVILCGVFGALMTIFYVYSADPNRTQPVLQTILMGLRIVPSVILTKIILKKSNQYKPIFIIPSMTFLAGSIGLAIIPLASDFSVKSIVWLIMFLISVICAALYSIFQEKYITDTNDRTLANKMVLIFWTRIIQLIIVSCCYWLEFVIGHSDHPGEEFRNSSRVFFSGTIDTLILECGIISYLLGYIVSTFLNAISTNYNMVASAGAQPVTILFFTIFPSLNNGVKYPWYISVSCAIAALISVILWMKGESKKPIVPTHTIDGYSVIHEPSNSESREKSRFTPSSSLPINLGSTQPINFGSVSYGSSNYGLSNYGLSNNRLSQTTNFDFQSSKSSSLPNNLSINYESV